MNDNKERQPFRDYLLSKGFSNSSASRYIRDTETFLKWVVQENIPHECIVYADVLHYIQGRKKKVNQRTVSAGLNSLKHYFNFLRATGQYTENPTTEIKIHGVKRKILYHILTRTELESLYNNFEIPDQESKGKNHNWFRASVAGSKRNKVILGLMIYQGLNSHELERLTINDIRLKEGNIYIAGSRRSNERTLTLEALQILDIMEYISKTRNEIIQLRSANQNYKPETENCKLFLSIGSSDRFNNVITKLIKKVHHRNNKVKSVKQLRASVITHWLKLYNLRQVQYMAGHRYVSSTETYLINDMDDLQEDINKYHPIG